mmetsp:Transcript_27155/g.56537  ORF Transcript_27155/g.56537 Transcript_27155/m.56537 type:complete len:103 (-) Transcript_27155:181-489(-)
MNNQFIHQSPQQMCYLSAESGTADCMPKHVFSVIEPPSWRYIGFSSGCPRSKGGTFSNPGLGRNNKRFVISLSIIQNLFGMYVELLKQIYKCYVFNKDGAGQ